MEPNNSAISVQHGVDTTFVTFKDMEILDEESIKALEKSIMPIVEEAEYENLLLNFCNVQFMSSAFLGLLVKIHKRICERGGHLQLRNIDPELYKVFKITKLNKVFDIS